MRGGAISVCCWNIQLENEKKTKQHKQVDCLPQCQKKPLFDWFLFIYFGQELTFGLVC